MNDIVNKKKPDKISNISGKIKECIEKGNYLVTAHAFNRQNERFISLPECLHVLESGYEEKRKSCFDITHNTWKYAIRGKTLREELDVRVIVAFDKNDMLIITVMHVGEL